MEVANKRKQEPRSRLDLHLIRKSVTSALEWTRQGPFQIIAEFH
jgi:hypothetical protein